MFARLFGLVFGAVAAAQLYPGAKDSNGNTIPTYSPLRPPAVPLAVRGPYTNAWSSTSNNGTLNTNGVIFWPGQALGWEGMISVDGIAYEYLGTGSQSLPSLPYVKPAVPKSVVYDSQYSNFTFTAGPVEVLASFLSPVIPQDLCRQSIPLSYLQTSFVSLDGKPHDVSLYSDVNGAWISYESNSTIQWNLYNGGAAVNGSANATKGGVYSWIFALKEQYEFGELFDFPLWGNFTYSSAAGSAQNFSFQSGYQTNLLYNFAQSPYLSDIVDTNYRGSGSQEPVFAYAHNFGNATTGSALYTIGNMQDVVMRYLTSGGVLPLQPWWSKCYGNMFSTIDIHYADFATSSAKAQAFESQLKSDVNEYFASSSAMVYSNASNSSMPYYGNGSRGYADGTDQYGEQYVFDPNTAYGFLDARNFSGVAVPDLSEAENYYAIVALSARQVMGAYTLAIPPTLACDNSTTNNQSEPLMFQKEISSDGNVNTVDVMYPAMPFFLYANPELLRYNLNPLYYNEESGFYPNGYSMHDLGSNYPNATGHVEGNDEYMPVEESGNMLIMTYAYYKFSGNVQYLQQHYAKLAQWASYLIEYSLIPGAQLSTDDFAGVLQNQTNLAVKGIVGLQAMSQISRVVGNLTAAANYSATAQNYFNQWEYFAIDPSGKHTLLAYQWRSSWGLLYNTFPDKLLNLGIIPQSLYDMQSEWYPTVSQVFGVPLDNRDAFTKSDWEMWTAGTCSPSTRRLFINALAYWLNYTSTPYAFSDLYETADQGYYPVDPNRVTFIARPVVGGHFSLLALLRAGENSLSGTGNSGSSFTLNGTNALTEVAAPYLTASGAGKSFSTSISMSSVVSSLTGGISFSGGTTVESTVNSIQPQTTVFPTTA